jgi:hypothetical protein
MIDVCMMLLVLGHARTRFPRLRNGELEQPMVREITIRLRRFAAPASQHVGKGRSHEARTAARPPLNSVRCSMEYSPEPKSIRGSLCYDMMVGYSGTT